MALREELNPGRWCWTESVGVWLCEYEESHRRDTIHELKDVSQMSDISVDSLPTEVLITHVSKVLVLPGSIDLVTRPCHD